MSAVETAIVRLIRAGGPLAEDVILRELEAQEVDEQCTGVDTLFAMVQSGVLNWSDPPGGDAEGTKPLIYSLTRKGRAACLPGGERP